MSKELDTIKELESKKELLKRTVCKDSTDDELELFIHVCKRTGLDPFAKQIYAIKRGAIMTIQTGIDGYRLIAERTGKYMPGKEPSFVYDKNGKLFSATSYVKKLAPDGSWHECAATAIYSEYVVDNNKIWRDKPHIMLAKCSESLALRRAFPSDMSGVHTDDEMHAVEIPKRYVEPPQEIEIEDPKAISNFLDKFHYLDEEGILLMKFLEEKRKDMSLEKFALKCVNASEEFTKFLEKWITEQTTKNESA